MIRAALFFLAAIALSACGFRPLYATGEQGFEGSDLSDIRLTTVRGGGDSRYPLEEALRSNLPNAKGDARYEVAVQLRERRQAVAVRTDNTTQRFNYLLTASIQYVDKETGERRLQNLQSTTSFGVVSSQYASLIGREDAARRAGIDLARQIQTDMALYVKGRAPQASDRPAIQAGDRRDPLEQFEREKARQEAEEAAAEETPE